MSNKDQKDSDSNYSFHLLTEFPFETFSELIPYDPRNKNDNIDELKAFYSEMDFDMILQLFHDSKTIGMVALSSREDTRYSELNIVASDKRYPRLTEILLDGTLRELSKRKMEYISITLEENDPIIEIIDSIGFQQRSRSLFYSKEI